MSAEITQKVERSHRRTLAHLTHHAIGPGSEISWGGTVITLGRLNEKTNRFAVANVPSGSVTDEGIDVPRWLSPTTVEDICMEGRIFTCTCDCAPLRPSFEDLVS